MAHSILQWAYNYGVRTTLFKNQQLTKRQIEISAQHCCKLTATVRYSLAAHGPLRSLVAA